MEIRGSFVKFTLAIVLMGLLVVGCKRDDEIVSPTEAPGVTVALGGVDVKPDGTLSPQGLQQLQEKSGEAALNVNFVRTNLSDAGLMQLAKFPNLRKVTASGGKFTDKGVEQLKKANPQVEVSR